MSLARARSARRIKSSNTCGAESSWSRFGWVKSVVIAGLACRFDRLSRHASRAQEQNRAHLITATEKLGKRNAAVCGSLFRVAQIANLPYRRFQIGRAL